MHGWNHSNSNICKFSFMAWGIAICAWIICTYVTIIYTGSYVYEFNTHVSVLCIMYLCNNIIFTFLLLSSHLLNAIICIVGLCVGGSKRKSVLYNYAIKYQVCCMENTVCSGQHIQYSYLILVCNQCSKQPPWYFCPPMWILDTALNGFTKASIVN